MVLKLVLSFPAGGSLGEPGSLGAFSGQRCRLGLTKDPVGGVAVGCGGLLGVSPILAMS